MPERGLICASYPCGNSIVKPSGIRCLSNGIKVIGFSLAAYKQEKFFKLINFILQPSAPQILFDAKEMLPNLNKDTTFYLYPNGEDMKKNHYFVFDLDDAGIKNNAKRKIYTICAQDQTVRKLIRSGLSSIEETYGNLSIAKAFDAKHSDIQTSRDGVFLSTAKSFEERVPGSHSKENSEDVFFGFNGKFINLEKEKEDGIIRIIHNEWYPDVAKYFKHKEIIEVLKNNPQFDSFFETTLDENFNEIKKPIKYLFYSKTNEKNKIVEVGLVLINQNGDKAYMTPEVIESFTGIFIKNPDNTLRTEMIDGKKEPIRFVDEKKVKEGLKIALEKEAKKFDSYLDDSMFPFASETVFLLESKVEKRQYTDKGKEKLIQIYENEELISEKRYSYDSEGQTISFIEKQIEISELTDEELEWILICIKEYNGCPLHDKKHTHIAHSKGTCRTTWQCHKCMTMITTVQEDAGFINGYGDGKLRKGPCAAGGDNDWHEITEREWLD